MLDGWILLRMCLWGGKAGRNFAEGVWSWGGRFLGGAVDGWQLEEKSTVNGRWELSDEESSLCEMVLGLGRGCELNMGLCPFSVVGDSCGFTDSKRNSRSVSQ